jgi:hypothetical protein
MMPNATQVAKMLLTLSRVSMRRTDSRDSFATAVRRGKG